ncbi:HK97 family phage prohead protease [Blastococcus sp. TF02A-26]|uniref:HK97 family phage prohead protease n=1 Tax=Blastococcus sp. TF02A-26 TaxID=2250577 RepID=UPI000DE95E09|nr:HK97 family phage prohead protease [Blastococcus sp. TF02A-26]RBY82678.1 HK97 family phage prohead protease [Blastococcus sp. TF02A-26]
MSTATLPSAAKAAELRAAGAAALADSPSARRGAPAADAPAVVRMPISSVQFRASGDGDGEIVFDGIASTYERGYEMWDWYGPYTEVVSAGAGALSLSRNPDVAFLLNHRGMTLARTKSGTLELSEVDEGLRAVARLDTRVTAVRDIQVAVERGDLDEMSFAFRITKGKWSPNYDEYRIEEYDIDRGDVSIVNFGANPHTADGFTGFRSAEILAGLAHLDGAELERAAAAIEARRGQLLAAGPVGTMGAAELDAIVRELAPHPLAARYATA